MYKIDSEQNVLDMFDNSVLHSELFRQRCFPPIHQQVDYVYDQIASNRKTYKREIQSILTELVHKLALSFNENNFIQYCFLKCGLCILSGSEMKFSCPISAVYYFQQYYEYFFDRSDLKRDCHDFEEFLLESISLFDPIALRSSSFKNKSLIYHHEMYRCMRMICDETVSALVGGCFGIRGAVDLYVNSIYKYAIELVKDGKHQSRFVGNGNCENIDINKYALIDFYEDQSIRSKLLCCYTVYVT